MGGSLFMPDEHELDARIDQRVEDRHRGAAGVAEHDLHALAFEALNDFVAAGGNFLNHKYSFADRHRGVHITHLCFKNLILKYLKRRDTERIKNNQTNNYTAMPS